MLEMNSELSISPELAEGLSECAVGSTESLTVQVKVTQNDEQGIKAEVLNVEKGDLYEEEIDSEAEDVEELPSTEKKGPSGNPALMVIVGGKPSKK